MPTSSQPSPDPPPVPDDVALLADEFPGWVCGAYWVAVGSGPDRRCLFAARDGVHLSGWSRAGLAEDIRAAERKLGPL